MPSVVLIIDDNELMREALSRYLGLNGYATVEAAGGREALEWLSRNPPPSVIVLDLLMPDMDGVEFFRRQQQDAALAGIPVVVLSGKAQESLSPLVRPAAYLEKPIDSEKLLAAIQRLAG